MNITIKINKRRSKLTPKGYPIVVYATKNYQEREWRTGYFTHLNVWDERLGSPKRQHPEYYHLLDYLSFMRSKINEAKLESKTRSISFEETKEFLFNTKRDSFLDAAMGLFDDGFRGTEWSAIRRFDKFYPNSTFDNVSKHVAISFRDQLLSEGHRHSGVDSYIRSLKALWNKLTDKPNPFKGIVTPIPQTIKTVASTEDLLKLSNARLASSKEYGGFEHLRNYWLLMFFLGGIDPEVLSKLRYDQHVIHGRIVFNRNKGNSRTSCNNIIPERAKEILERYKEEGSPFLVPIHKAKSYRSFSTNFSRRMRELSRKVGLSIELRPKSARYTFIDRAQQLLIDERVTAQIVGHKRRTTTSLYTNDFPLEFQDNAHFKIIQY